MADLESSKKLCAEDLSLFLTSKKTSNDFRLLYLLLTVVILFDPSIANSILSPYGNIGQCHQQSFSSLPSLHSMKPLQMRAGGRHSPSGHL